MTMEKSNSFQGRAGRRRLLATLGSLSLVALLSRGWRSVDRARRQIAARKDGHDSGAGAVKTGHDSGAGGGKIALDCGPVAGKPVRMLTQDGKLVEVDPGVTKAVRKASNEDLQNWIKTKKL